MKALRKLASLYFDTWWVPTVTGLVFLGALVVSPLLPSKHIVTFTDVVLVLLGVSLVGMLAAGVWNFVRKQWVRGIVNLLMLPLIAVAASLGLGLVMFASMSGPSEDGFGKDIVIPLDMALEEPRPERQDPDAAKHIDPEGAEFVSVFSDQTGWPDTPEINTDVEVLDQFAGPRRAMLLRHLATSAKWYLTEDHGELYAYRRFVTGHGRWENSLNGYYSRYDFDQWDDGHFQFRIILGVDGPVMDQPWSEVATMARTGSGLVSLRTREGTNPGYDSYLVLRSSGPALEIFEQAETTKRPFTPLALSSVERELTALLQSEEAGTRGFDPSLMPVESVRRGPPDLWLYHGFQGGIYQVCAYVNPGSRGRVYLKVYEATQNTPLSTQRIAERSTEYVGWSEDPGETFFYNTEITVYEGDWGVYYPARFELWFVPDSGGEERKLAEKIFKIEGWQR